MPYAMGTSIGYGRTSYTDRAPCRALPPPTNSGLGLASDAPPPPPPPSGPPAITPGVHPDTLSFLHPARRVRPTTPSLWITRIHHTRE
ncbi:hypothetical protein GCM10023205_84220 [Yinghuangia aomiensis]|uniref:Uncharacterized protein n=1 Tax=Yinghuangia aomiensis TaxID=676205 RepID=A0ABP9IJF5_9ACTN